MQKSLFALIKDGQTYSEVWPMRQELVGYFPELRVIKATQFAMKTMPALVAISLVVQISFLGNTFLPSALTIATLLLSLPVQGYLWLGKRANETLSIALMGWYRELEQKLRLNGNEVPQLDTKPRYFDLAYLLKRAFDETDRAFKQDNF